MSTRFHSKKFIEATELPLTAIRFTVCFLWRTIHIQCKQTWKIRCGKRSNKVEKNPFFTFLFRKWTRPFEAVVNFA